MSESSQIDPPKQQPQWLNSITDKLALIQSTVKDNNDTLNGLTKTVEFLSSKLELTTTELNSIKRENAELKVSHTQLTQEIRNLKKPIRFSITLH